MKLKLLLIILVFSFTTFSQDKDSTLNKWIPSAVAGFNISQLALSNWS